MKILLNITRRLFQRKLSVVEILFIMSDVGALAQANYDSLSVTVYYPCGSSNLSQVSSNKLSLQQFIHQIDSVCQMPSVTPVSLYVTSAASPEGSLKINKSLTNKRNLAVTDYLRKYSETFRKFSNSLECKYSEQTTNHQLGKVSLSDFPLMRYSKVTLLFNILNDTVQVVEQPAKDDVQSVGQVIPTPTDSMVTTIHPVFFIKTNLLYDVLTFVNASVEIPVTNDITAEATIVYPWWRDTSRHKTVQMRYLAVTPRYYFKQKDNPYTSLFAGLTIGGGKYDLQWTRRGVQGSMWHISPVIGYSHHISKRWKMEYSASVGFVHTKYQKYTQTPDTPFGEIKVKDYPWVSKVLNTVLPTSLNVSLVYTFTRTKHLQRHEL